MPEEVALDNTIGHREGSDRPKDYIHPILIEDIMNDLEYIDDPTYQIELA